MKTRNISIIRCAIQFAVIAALAVSPVFADFEETGYGARPLGMGNAFVGLSDDVYGVVYNPASLGFYQPNGLAASHRKLFSGLDDGSDPSESFVAYARPFSFGVMGFAYYNFDVGSSYSEKSYILSYGKKATTLFGSPLYAGGSVKALSKQYGSDLYTENAVDFNGSTFGRDPVFANGYGKTAFAVDLSLFYRISNRFSTGLVMKNINRPDTSLKDGELLPLQINAGGAYGDGKRNIVLDVESRNDDTRFLGGYEQWFASHMIGARGGLQYGNRDLLNATIGASCRYGIFSLDYAFLLPLQGIKESSGSHMISFALRFERLLTEKKHAGTNTSPVVVSPEPVGPETNDAHRLLQSLSSSDSLPATLIPEDHVNIPQPAAPVSQAAVVTEIKASSQSSDFPQLTNIYFKRGSAEFITLCLPLVEHNADYLKRHPELNILIETYGDGTGSEAAFKALNTRRAICLKEHYVQNGIASERITILPHGKMTSSDPDYDHRDHSRNRRAITNVSGISSK